MTKTIYSESASKLHKKIGEILTTTSPWTGFKCEQEVLVKDLFPSFSGSRERYDWVIKDLFTVIEAHGIQHFEVQSFGQNAGEALMNFNSQKFRDEQKEEIARLNNWTYIMIPYSDEKKLTPEYLQEVYNANKSNKLPLKSTIHKQAETSDYKSERLAHAKIWRRKQYEHQKEYKRRLDTKK